MRVVLDTNVVASALLWGGTPERVIEAAGEGVLEDAAVLACALAARAGAIVSGDDDLLSLGSYHQIPIVSAAQVLRIAAA